MRGITKSFGGTRVVDAVDFEVCAGEVHALVGENGAGKSTLMKIAAGIHQPDAGRMLLGGRPFQPASPQDSLRSGIGMVHQELSLAPDVSVAENILAGREPRRGCFVDWKELYRRASVLLSEFGLAIDPSAPVSSIGIGYRQIIEILKAMSAETRIIVFDEPTSSLEAQEAELVLATIRRLAARSVGVVYISHRMNEVFTISDRISVMRDGKLVLTRAVREAGRDEIVNAMVGRTFTDLYPPKGAQFGDELLRVESFTRAPAFEDVSFTLRKGEVLGFSGLVGSGRTELMRAIFAADPIDSGSVYLEGRPVLLRSIPDAIGAGIAYCPEDRKLLGLFLDRSVEDNIACASLRECSSSGMLRPERTRDLASRFCTRLSVKTTGLEQEVASLSGGNQQKVLLARWIATRPKVLIVDEPTRGVDVGAKSEIHKMLRAYTNDGNGVIVVSSEMPELIGLCDRIIAMHSGRMTGELPGASATEEQLIRLIVGHARA